MAAITIDGIAAIAFSITACLLIALYALDWQPWHGGSAREPRFFKTHQTRSLIKADADGYAASLTTADLHARHSASVSDYIESSMRAAADFTEDERARIRECTAEIDAMPGLQALARVPWVFAKTEELVYENGLPHTRCAVIFLCPETTPEDDDALTNLLIHEKVHVFQRMFPDPTYEYIAARGYKRTPTKRADHSPLVRSNPDLDEWIYTENVEGEEEPMAAV